MNKKIIDDSVNTDHHQSVGLFTIYYDEIPKIGEDHTKASITATDTKSINCKTARLLDDLRKKYGSSYSIALLNVVSQNESDVTSSIESQSILGNDTNNMLDAMEDICSEIESEYIKEDKHGTRAEGNERFHIKDAGQSPSLMEKEKRRNRRQTILKGNINASYGTSEGPPNASLVSWASSQVQYTLRILCGEYASLALSAATKRLSQISNPSEVARVHADMIHDMKVRVCTCLACL